MGFSPAAASIRNLIVRAHRIQVGLWELECLPDSASCERDLAAAVLCARDRRTDYIVGDSRKDIGASRTYGDGRRKGAVVSVASSAMNVAG